MPIAQYDFVMLRRATAQYTQGFQGQPPLYGLCYNVGVGDLRSIIWSDGSTAQNIDEDVLDRIDTPTAQPLTGKVVELDLSATAAFQPSGSYDATVVAEYRRNPAGDGPLSADLVLCKLLNSDVYIETLAANATALDNR
jgi:hypothetical protein